MVMVQAQTAQEARGAAPAGDSTSQPPRRIGIHTSIADGVAESLELARRLRCTTIQIFTASPRMWVHGARGLGEEGAALFRERRGAFAIDPVVVHANYLLNLAAREGPAQERTIDGFQGELRRAAQLGADYLVVHPGSRGETTIESAIERIASLLRRAAVGLPTGPPRVLIENTAGQGTAVGWRLEELRAILDACPELGLGVCLDTAHLFAAGYDVKSAAGLEQTLEQADQAIGLEAVRVIHVNDSKVPLGAHVDRHEHIGRGQIGREAFGRIVNHPRLAGRAFILETPIDRPGDDWRNVRTMWRLAGVEWKQRAPGADGLRSKPKRTRGRPRRVARGKSAKRMRGSRLHR